MPKISLSYMNYWKKKAPNLFALCPKMANPLSDLSLIEHICITFFFNPALNTADIFKAIILQMIANQYTEIYYS